MKNRRRMGIVSAALLLLLMGCGEKKQGETAPPVEAETIKEEAAAEEVPASQALLKDLIVLYTSDVHSNVNEGMGYAGIAALKKQYEEEGNHVLLVDAGDAVQGTPLGTVSEGTYVVDIMNRAGYDVAVPGNHEFDYGMDQFKTLVERADYPYVSCNFMDLQTQTPVLEPYVMIDLDGVNVAFVGATTPATVTSSTPAHFQNGSGEFIYGFGQDADGKTLYDLIQTNVDKARADGAQYVFLVGHLGIAVSTSPWMSTEVIENTNGIDALIDGHSHSTQACERMKNKDGDWVLLTQTGPMLSNVGMLLLTKEGNLTTGFVTGEGSDEEVASFIGGIEKEYEEQLGQVIGKSNTVLTVNDPNTGERLIRNAETNLGDFCADAYRLVTGADIAFVNGGGIRADVPKGDVTYGDILSIHPYSNQICVVEATGQEILDALELGASEVPEETGGFLQVSGLSYTIDTAIASTLELDENGMFVSVGKDRRVKDVTVDGQPIDPAKIYTLASHDYLLKNGGDGYTMFAGNTFVVEDFMVDNQVLMNYVEQNLGGTIPNTYEDAYGDGRITIK